LLPNLSPTMDKYVLIVACALSMSSSRRVWAFFAQSITACSCSDWRSSTRRKISDFRSRSAFNSSLACCASEIAFLRMRSVLRLAHSVNRSSARSRFSDTCIFSWPVTGFETKCIRLVTNFASESKASEVSDRSASASAMACSGMPCSQHSSRLLDSRSKRRQLAPYACMRWHDCWKCSCATRMRSWWKKTSELCKSCSGEMMNSRTCEVAESRKGWPHSHVVRSECTSACRRASPS